MKNLIEKNTELVKKKADEFGFLSCGISKAEFLENEARHLENWLTQNLHGEMRYMENYFDERLDPRLLLEGCKSVISFAYNYFPRKVLNEDNNFKISKYAYGQDYHKIIKEILADFVKELQDEIGEFGFRIFVDSAPVLERAWAKKSGIGWVGKNSNLITKGEGSFYFLAEIISELDLVADAPVLDHCGTCRKCIESCPTGAILDSHIVDGSKCISYATIELKDDIPSYFHGKMQNWIFGCDICQDVCPWNRFSKAHQQPLFDPNDSLQNFSKKEWKELTQEVFSEIFRKSPIKRAKYTGLKRNIDFLLEENH